MGFSIGDMVGGAIKAAANTVADLTNGGTFNPVKLADTIVGSALGMDDGVVGGLLEGLDHQLEAAGLGFLGEGLQCGWALYSGDYLGAIEHGIDTLTELNQASDPGPPGEAIQSIPSEQPAAIASAPGTTNGPSIEQTKPATAGADPAEGTAAKKESDEKKGKDAARAFMAKHPDSEDFMEAVMNGEMPDSLANSQGGMMMIQQRMNQIQRMFQLMTQMMESMHKMQMEIVRNIRG